MCSTPSGGAGRLKEQVIDVGRAEFWSADQLSGSDGPVDAESAAEFAGTELERIAVLTVDQVFVGFDERIDGCVFCTQLASLRQIPLRQWLGAELPCI